MKFNMKKVYDAMSDAEEILQHMDEIRRIQTRIRNNEFMIGSSKTANVYPKNRDLQHECRVHSVEDGDACWREAFSLHKKAEDIAAQEADRLTKWIAEAEGRSSVRTITYKDVYNALQLADEHLSRISTRKDAVGTVVICDVNGQKFPGAYKGQPMSTHFRANMTSSGWTVVDVYRSPCWRSRRMKFELTDATKKNMEHILSELEY